jgi:predicted nucleic acid-binding protein
MIDKICLDSNIWLYLFLKDAADKYKIVEEYLRKYGTSCIFVISYQVINEVTNQLLRHKFSEEINKQNIEYMYSICTIQDFTKSIIMRASAIREKYCVSFWDSTILASAIESNCSILATEDLQAGLKIENTTIVNIFKEK